ncbi:MAG: RNA methyltransferase [Bdellovibrio sp.]|nr:RNA methyltransferase [Bdellovibrio sp.]
MKRKAPLAVALMHYPTKDRLGKLVATNITNFDIHDIARACRVYGIERYYLVHPLQDQLMFVERVLDHWNVGEGSKFNPMRKTALRDARTAENLEAAVKDWGHQGARVVATAARSTIEGQVALSFKGFKEVLETEDQPYVLVFGTGFGLTQDFMKTCYGVLEPIKGDSDDDYRHLSVRSAVSICLDRLLGS